MPARAGYIMPRVPPSPIQAAARVANQLPPTSEGWASRCTVTTVKDHGPGSLRQAIAGAGPGCRIHFALPLPATIVLSSTLVITQDVAVVGPGPGQLTVMRSSASNTPDFRIFDVEAGVVTLAGMTIQNGSAYSGSNLHDNLGGGILNYGLLTVSNCVVTGNNALTTDWGTNASPSLSVGFGAGVFSAPGSQLALVNSTISDNYATGAGGGLFTWYADNLVAMGSTLSGNSANVQGGGLNFQGLVGTLQNSTISSNSTPPEAPGSGLLLITFPGESATLTLTACTVAGNFGSTNGACTLAALSGNAGLTNKLLSTLIADNEGPNFFLDGNPVLESFGHNLDSDGTSGLANGVNGDLVGSLASPIDARLGPLQDNGGPTFTMELLPGSPAIDAGACTDANGSPLLVDQRGLPRPQGAGCDIGAYESQPLTLICPPDVVVEFINETGAVATFGVTVTNACPDVTTVLTPPSGSVFPIGVTPVLAQAMDSCSNSAQCGFTVTVLGAQGVKSNVLAELKLLRAGVTNAFDRWELDRAIVDVAASLGLYTPHLRLWLDQTHISRTSGGLVFFYEKDAVKELQKILSSRKSQIPAATAQDIIDRLIRCDRLLAVVSIQDAAAAGLRPGKVALALAMVAKADGEAAAGHYTSAIEHYRIAWRQALSLHLRVRLNPDRTAQVEFAGNESKSYLIEASSDMVHWAPVGTCTEDADGNVAFTDPHPSAGAVRFYRAVEQ